MNCPPCGTAQTTFVKTKNWFDSTATHRGDVDEPDEESDDGDADRHMGRLQAGELVADGRYYAGAHRNVAADPEDEQHEEEGRGEHLRQVLEPGDRVRVGDERESGASLDDLGDVVGADFVRQMPQNAEYSHSGQQRRERVDARHNRRVTVHVVIESVERCIHDEVAEADGQREEALRHRLVPNLPNGIRLHRFRSIFGEFAF